MTKLAKWMGSTFLFIREYACDGAKIEEGETKEEENWCDRESENGSRGRGKKIDES